MQDSTHWKNRIVGQGEMPAGQFVAHYMNWRIHPAFQQEAMEGVLDDIGWIQQVIVNRRTQNLIDGHMRVMLALKHGEETPVPFLEIDVSEQEELKILATLDPISSLAVTDVQQLEALVKEAELHGEAAAMIADIIKGGHGFTPSLDDLSNQYGDESEQAFWPVIKAQVSPETKDKFDAIKKAWLIDDESLCLTELIVRAWGTL